MSSPWRAEFYWLGLISLVALLFGKMTGLYLLSVCLGLLAYLFRHLHHINRLLVWLRTGGKLPVSSGIWEEIYYLIYRLRRRNKSRKKKLIAMLERFRTATAALPDATVVLDARDEIDWFNDAAELMLGLRKGDIGQQIGNLLRNPKFTDFLSATRYDAKVSIASPVNDKWQLEIRIVPYGEDLRLLIAQDVTQIRFMERVRSDFVSNVSHELRTPLTVLKGYVETLGDAGDTVLPPHYAKAFQRMDEQIVRMQRLIDGLLSLTKLESGVVAPARRVAVRPLLTSICDEARLLARPGQQLHLDLGTVKDLSGMESELRSAFSNLIVNALKYSGETGQVWVRWRDESGGAVLEVEDNGPGIAAEHLPRLTERFYRVENGKMGGNHGVGLGLAIVKHVLTRHEAELKIASSLGKGSCFFCKFPEKRVICDSL